MCRLLAGALAGLVALIAMSATPAAANAPQANGQILFARFDPLLDDNVIYTVNPDGSHERQVLPLALGCPHWSPDGTRIVTCGGPANSATTLINPDDGSYRLLPMPDPDNLFTACPVMSPDAARLACEGIGQTDPSLNGIYTIRTSDGGGLTRMTSNPGGDDIPGDYSPQGKRLVFARFDRDGDPIALFVVKIDGAGLRQITPTRTIFSGGGGGNDWSPQGNEIVFSQRVTPDVRSSLWVVNADGSGLHEIHLQGQPPCGGPISDPTARGCFEPRWSPDGKKIVFGIFTAVAGRNIYTVNADGTGLTQVTHGDDDILPDWGTHPLTR